MATYEEAYKNFLLGLQLSLADVTGVHEDMKERSLVFLDFIQERGFELETCLNDVLAHHPENALIALLNGRLVPKMALLGQAYMLIDDVWSHSVPRLQGPDFALWVTSPVRSLDVAPQEQAPED